MFARQLRFPLSQKISFWRIILFHVVLWCISIQRTRQNILRRSDNQMENLGPGTGMSTVVIKSIYNRATKGYLRIPGRNGINANGESGAMDTKLEISTFSLLGDITIRSTESNYYLCMNKKGEVVGRQIVKRERGMMCVFTEGLDNAGYSQFYPLDYTNMFLGFKKMVLLGRLRKLNRTIQ